MVSDEALDELLEFDEVPEDDESLEDEVLLLELELLELPLALDTRSSTSVEPLELPDAPAPLEPPGPPPGGGPPGGPPAPPGPLANALAKTFCNSLA